MVSIDVRNLGMTYRVPVRPEGLAAAFRSIGRREYREIRAVDDVSMEIGPGQIVGFIGPNGAGKTTTLKMLSGILHPTAGSVDVLGFRPWDRDPRFLRQIAMIRGSQPISGPAEITVMDALRLQQKIYGVSASLFRERLDQMTEWLHIGNLVERQLRALSLGERMRCGLATSLIHGPSVLFMDEPTIGLDVSVVEDLRSFLRRYCDESGATILLTSHNLGDVEQLCHRIILIDHGAIVYDGELAALVHRVAPDKIIHIHASELDNVAWEDFGTVVERLQSKVAIRVPKSDAVPILKRLLDQVGEVSDVSINDPTIEEVITRVYRQGVAA